jgi:hypothetical protein
VTSNVAEVFNNWIKDIKDLPVVELVDKIREMVMVLFFQEEKKWRKVVWKNTTCNITNLEC